MALPLSFFAALVSASCLSTASAWVVANASNWPPVNPGPLPLCSICGYGSVSGISSGADFASIVLVANSNKFFGVGAFAGQAYGCATTRFPGEEVYTCDSQPAGQKGPGCVGLNSTGAAPCIGCTTAGTTVEYDHCKKNPSAIDLQSLHNWTQVQVNEGLIPDPNTPLTLAASRIYTYRGTLDTVYLPGSVNKTGAFFAPYLENPKEQIHFEASIPSQHALPTIDPNVPPETCGNYTIAGLQNCGYDGAGRMLQHFYSDALRRPPPNATAYPSSLLAFSQDMYGNASMQYGGLASFGLAYVPYQCQYDDWVSCFVHVVLHGCGQSAVELSVNTTFALYSGYAPWADANDIVILFVQGGGFAERGWTTDAAQVMAGCHDGYGQTGADYANTKGVVETAIQAMLVGLGGPYWWD